MSWIKTGSSATVNGFTTYKEIDAYGSPTYTATDAITGLIGGRTIVGIQTSDGNGTADTTTANAISLQVSTDNTNWATVKQATTIALVGSGSRAFTFDLTGIHAPYMRLYSDLTTHTGTYCTWEVVLKD